MTTQRFYVTFGQRYHREAHPTFPAAHPDGYLLVEAANEASARHLTVSVLDDKWSSLYDEADFDASFHPRGRLGVLSASLRTEEQLRQEFTEVVARNSLLSNLAAAVATDEQASDLLIAFTRLPSEAGMLEAIRSVLGKDWTPLGAVSTLRERAEAK